MKNTTNSSHNSNNVTRRHLMKVLSATGIAASGMSLASAQMMDNTAQLVETGWKFNISTPKDFNTKASLADIDEVPYHAVSVAENEVILSPWATPGIVGKFKSSDRVVFTDGYYTADTGKPSVSGVSHDGAFAATELNVDTRRLSAFDLSAAPDIPSPNISFNELTVVVDGPMGETHIKTGEQVKISYSQQQVEIEERIPAVDPRNDRANDAPMFKTRKMPATPIFVVQNHGELGISIDKKSDVVMEKNGDESR